MLRRPSKELSDGLILSARSDLAHLERFAAHPKFLGVRPMIQDIPDVNWMLREDIEWAFRAIIDLDITFDALGFPIHLPNFLTLITRYPEMRVVYDHCMKPQICDQRAGKDAFSQWAAGMSRLADETRGCCKFSGIVTEAGNGWTIDDLTPLRRACVECLWRKPGYVGIRLARLPFAGGIWRLARHSAGFNARLVQS